MSTADATPPLVSGMSSAAAFLGGGDGMASLIAAFDWSATPLGPLARWPSCLRTATSLLVRSPVPIAMLWGEQGIMIYNDAYAVFAGSRHPGLLGSRVREGWPEVASFNDNVMAVGLAGQTLAYRDQELTLYRQGVADQVWMNLDYSPVLDEDGRPVGVIAIVIETTARIEAERRQREAEALLRVERDRARDVLENMGEGVVLLDRDFRVVDINAEALRLERRSRDEIVGHSHWDAWPGTETSVLGRTIARVMAERVPASLEHHYLWPDGGDAWLDLRVYPTADGLALFYRDVTGRRRADEALRDSERNLRDLNADLERQVLERSRERGRTWQVSPDLLGVVNANGHFESSNPAWGAVLGWSAAEIARTPFAEFVHPDDIPTTVAIWEGLRRGTPALRFENRYRRRDGVYRWLSWVAVPEGDKVYCSARDVTAEKEQALALSARTAERDRLWQNSQDLQVIVDGQGVFQNVSPSVSRVLGWSSDEMIGRTVFDFVVPEDETTTESALTLATREALPVFENRYRHKEGGFRWMSWVAAPDGELIYASGRHITAEKEQALALAAAQEALRQSQKMEAVGQLTGGIAHDFNNLLAGITGSLELLETRLSQGRLGGIERYIAAAQGSARRAASLTQRLLAFSRRQTLDPKPTDLNRLISGMEELLRRTVGPAILIEMVGAGGLWLTRVDPSQLENALLNLTINARDAMPDGGRVTIETANKWLDERAAHERELLAGQYVSLCVTDTGPGMTPDVIERAFDPFFTTKPLGQGTGLGLSMVHGFVRQSGGQVRIYSEPGAGTTMCLYLPRFVGDTGGAERDVVLDVADMAQGETVLVVDDEPTVRMLMVEVLEDAGYAAIEAGDGPAALRVLQSDARIDLLITDVGLPGGMNGRQVADAARVTRPNLRVLFVTGYAENAVIGNGHLDWGMQVITKPFAMAALGNKVREMIDG